MSTQISYNYVVQIVGGVADLELAVGNAPVDAQTLLFWGLRLLSDTTSQAGNTITRTLVVSMVPAVSAIITANLDLSKGPPSSIKTFNIGDAGSVYVRPPVLQIADSGGGIGYGASAYAELGVIGTAVIAAGALYSASTYAVASGGELAPGGTQATFTVALGVGGTISTVTVVNEGGPYNSPPTITIVDPLGLGSGADVVASLGVTNVVLTNPGLSYTAPIITVVPYFKAINPDTAPLAQAASVQGWMLGIIEQAAFSDAVTSAGVVS
jgi:hypothetical protein